MKRHVLLTVSEDLSALYGVRFTASFVQNKDMMEITLLYVAQGPEGSKSATCPLPADAESGLSENQCARGQAALDTARHLLLDKGFGEESIRTKLLNKRFGTVRDIAREAKAGLYDAVVFGRRGYILFEKTLATSVSREMMEHRINFPIWICRMPEENRKGVLVCVDDSEPSMRIADHVGFMLQKEEQHPITLMHASAGRRDEADAAIQKAEQHLKANGIEDRRIRRLVIPSSRVVNVILDELESGRYAVVAVGRGGSESRGILDKWLMGSVSMKLLETLDKAVLWVSK
ncbi:MAG: universal stress protein [Syntrophobacteraceae bacterium]|jgi:nucleotide-binding universal stress UspA family protein|nr:universal stress protein [Syntrophobacteraceae bacterium]